VNSINGKEGIVNYKTAYVLLALLVAVHGTVTAAQLIDVAGLLGDGEFYPRDLAVLPDGTVRFLGDYDGKPRIVDIDPTSATPLLGYTDFEGLMPGEYVAALAISPNGSYIVGESKSPTSDPIAAGQGVLWSTADPQNPIALDYAPSSPMNQGSAAGVANNGTAVGWSGGTATVWNTDGAVQELLTLGGLTWNGNIFGTTADGTKHVGSSTDADWGIVATLWDGEGNPMPLEDPYSWWSNAYAISPNGEYITGFMDTGQVPWGLTLWDGEGSLLAFIPSLIGGEVVGACGLDVSDTGVVVGSDFMLFAPDSTGYIYKPGWSGLDTIQNWAMNEFGIDIGHSFRGEGIVSYDGFDYIASYGSALLLVAEADVPPEAVPGPSGAVLVLFGVAGLARRRR